MKHELKTENKMHHIVALVDFAESVKRLHTDGGVETEYMPHHKVDTVKYLAIRRYDYEDEKSLSR